MAIVNVTPDSFSGDGVAGSVGEAVDLSASALADGADIVDVGGESTRPGAERVTSQQELERPELSPTSFARSSPTSCDDAIPAGRTIAYIFS